ncbi:hypothetical protein QQ008_19960 [Fulvivirgaceae bacterium BMA10]|uniref:Collagen-like protein n=1 Tax=Splendidivirga corallicola TaxID=3051826 RepID=A0ABT8KSE6_9BACT|nr:hypothetical protein [Fulvivirgaceae bacterium BMA10]
MRRIIYTIAILVFGMYSCEVGPEGPPGPVGPVGPIGPEGAKGEEGFTFEYIIDFEAPDYQVFLPFPDDFQVLDSDVVLVYLLWGQEEVNGEMLEIWRALPQTLITEDGLLQYNFDFTVSDVSLFLEADFPRSNLGPEMLNEWVARIVVVPAQFVETGRTASDYSDYKEVVKRFGLVDTPVDQKYLSIKRPAVKE